VVKLKFFHVSLEYRERHISLGHWYLPMIHITDGHMNTPFVLFPLDGCLYYAMSVFCSAICANRNLCLEPGGTVLTVHPTCLSTSARIVL
jgi:hypothetical protein